MTKVMPVLHKFTSTPSPLVFTPSVPFRCSHLMLWFSNPVTIKEFIVGKQHELIQPIPGELVVAPVTLDVIEQWFKDYVLPIMLSEHGRWPIVVSVANSHNPIKIEFDGEFDMLALYGAELHS